MMRLINQFSRFFVGGLFIFSGLIKINDPIGTEIKMEEYFDVFAQDFGSVFKVFIPWSLEIGMLMIVLELALGVAILLFWRMQLTTKVLLGLMVFFTFLTFYSAYFNKVTDCGCFGDAIKLTPWQSFWKDIILMVFVMHLFWYRKSYVSTLALSIGDAIIIAVIAISTFIGVYALNHLPFIDFRAYKIGNNIPQQMIAPAQPIIEYTFIKGGKEVKSLKYLTPEEGYQYLSSSVLNENEIKPNITDYSVTTAQGEDLTQSTFKGNKLLVVAYDIEKTSTLKIVALETLAKALQGKVECLLLTSSSQLQVEKFNLKNKLTIPYAFADATVLKTIIRSNPGICLWKDGTVLGNWHYNDLPTVTAIDELLK